MKKCKLCGEEKKLCRQSHIIPNFMYKDIFDKKNRIYFVKSEKGTIQQKGVRQSGEFDSNILCHNCDNNKLGKLERYASLILYEGHEKIPENRITSNGTKYVYCAELDYTKFKLFLLSILWRASISNRPFFKEVYLGPYEEQIRHMLISTDPGDQIQFPCLILTYLNLKNYPKDIVAQPNRLKVDGGTVYRFLIGGMIYLFYITKRIIPSWLADAAINPNGEMKIMYSPPRYAERTFNNLIGIKN